MDDKICALALTRKDVKLFTPVWSKVVNSRHVCFPSSVIVILLYFLISFEFVFIFISTPVSGTVKLNAVAVHNRRMAELPLKQTGRRRP